MTKRCARLSVAVGFAILFCLRLPNLTVTQDEQLNGSRWTLEAPSSTLLPSVEPPAAFNRSENNTFPSGAASYLNDTRPALLQTNKFFSSFLTTISAALTPTPAPVVASGAYLDSPAIIPGTVEVFRLDEDVNSKPTPTSGFYEGRTASGESTRYPVYVQIDGTRTTLSAMLLLLIASEYVIHRLLPHRRPTAALPREESNPRRRRPLRPMTPFGVDLPEDRPSAVRFRNAAHYAAIRRHQGSDAKQTQLEVGRDLHEKIKWEHARKAKRAKREAALRRQVVQAAIADEKLAKAAKAEKERDAFKKEYAKALADRQRGITKKKENIARELAERRSDMYDRRERRLMERALEAHATRTEARMIF